MPDDPEGTQRCAHGLGAAKWDVAQNPAPVAKGESSRRDTLARYMQRTGTADEEALLRDVDLVATADRDRLVVGGGFKVATNADGGGWRGRVIMQHHENGDVRNVLSVRTWLS